MTNVSIATAKDRLSEFAAAAAAGEDIVITRHGKPYVKLVKAVDEHEAQLTKQRAALAELKAYRIARGPTGITTDEIVAWVRDDRDG